MGGATGVESQPGVGSIFRCEWPLKVVAPVPQPVPGVNIGTLATWPPMFVIPKAVVVPNEV